MDLERPGDVGKGAESELDTLCREGFGEGGVVGGDRPDGVHRCSSQGVGKTSSRPRSTNLEMATTVRSSSHSPSSRVASDGRPVTPLVDKALGVTEDEVGGAVGVVGVSGAIRVDHVRGDRQPERGPGPVRVDVVALDHDHDFACYVGVGRAQVHDAYLEGGTEETQMVGGDTTRSGVAEMGVHEQIPGQTGCSGPLGVLPGDRRQELGEKRQRAGQHRAVAVAAAPSISMTERQLPASSSSHTPWPTPEITAFGSWLAYIASL